MSRSLFITWCLSDSGSCLAPDGSRSDSSFWMRRTTWHFRSCRVHLSNLRSPPQPCPLFNSSPIPFHHSNDSCCNGVRAGTVLSILDLCVLLVFEAIAIADLDPRCDVCSSPQIIPLNEGDNTSQGKAQMASNINASAAGGRRRRHKSWISSTSSIPPPRSSSAVAKSQDSEVTCPAWDHERTVGHEQKVPTSEDQDGNQSVFMSTRTHRLIKKATNCWSGFNRCQMRSAATSCK